MRMLLNGELGRLALLSHALLIGLSLELLGSRTCNVASEGVWVWVWCSWTDVDADVGAGKKGELCCLQSLTVFLSMHSSALQLMLLFTLVLVHVTTLPSAAMPPALAEPLFTAPLFSNEDDDDSVANG